MRLSVVKIISEAHFGSIFLGRVEDVGHPLEQKIIKVRASSSALLNVPAVGEVWEVDGEIQFTARYGDQMDATKAFRCLPSGKLIRHYLATHIPGIGTERAARLWETFQNDLGDILSTEDNVDLLAAAIDPARPVMSARLAAYVIRSWKQASSEAQLLAWMMRRGVEKPRIVSIVSRILGNDAVARLEANPYCLVPLLPWKEVDELGVRLLREAQINTPFTDKRRLVGAADAVMRDLLRTGATAMPDDAFRAALARKLGVSTNSPRVDAAHAAAVRNHAVSLRDGLLRAPGAAKLEDDVGHMLVRLLEMRASLETQSPDALRARLSSIDAEGPEYLHPEQAEAVLQVIQRPVACLQGGAGVGKTFTTRRICDLWEALGGRVELAALSGKAALRLSRSTKRFARTLARMLRDIERCREALADLSPRDEETDLERCDEVSKDAAATLFNSRTLLIIDESSMVDLVTIYRVLSELPIGAHLLLVGDECQLPPVGFGLIYHRLVNDPVLTSRLTVVHRQADDSRIPLVAAAIRNGEWPPFSRYVGKADDACFLEVEPGALPGTVRRVAQELGGFQGEDLLICSATYDGATGIKEINRQFHSDYISKWTLPEIKGHLGQCFSVGEPVIYLRNDYNRGLFNGSLGKIVSIDERRRSVIARFDDQDVLFTTDQLFDLALAYSITCHKAQGSQASRVIVPVYSTRILDPSWLYTAITRAEKQVVVIGARTHLEEALRRPWAAETRTVGFHWPLRVDAS